MRKPDILTVRNIAEKLATRDAVTALLGPDHGSWTVTEISDGNMNAVFRVASARQSIIAKYAPPYIRVIGESWPFPSSRIAFEQAALTEYHRICPDMVPAIIDYDADAALLVMEDLAGFTVLRRALIEGMALPRLAEQAGQYLAQTLFHTSDLALPTVAKKQLLERFTGNAELCATTETVIFTGPYWSAPLNKWNPLLDDMVSAIHQDREWHQAAADLNEIFRTRTQSLIHGDLHTGSIMVTPDATRVIDAEWAFHGPMGFDIGALIGNLLIAFCAVPGYGDNRDYADWILQTIESIWQQFAEAFRQLVLTRRHDGDDALLTARLFDDRAALAFTDRYLAQVLTDCAGFAGAKMTRRVIGISHVEDLEEIADPVLRARCERHVLTIARDLVVARNTIRSISDITTLAQRHQP